MGTGRTLAVLLIDSEPAAAELARLVLQQTGFVHHLTTLHDAHAAMRYLYREPPFENAAVPDLVFLDLQLPRTEGLGVLSEIRRLRSHRQKVIAVAVLAPSADERTSRAAVALGADAVFVKPAGTADAAALAATVRELWNRLTEALPLRRPQR